MDYADEWPAHKSANAASATIASYDAVDFHNAIAEVERQDRIYEDAINELSSLELSKLESYADLGSSQAIAPRTVYRVSFIAATAL